MVMSRSLIRSEKDITAIYERHVDMVYRVCFSYMKNTADTEDMVQNTFIQMISSEVDYLSEEHEKAWLIVTASNLCKNHLRHWWQKRSNLDDYEQVATTQPFEIDETLAVVLALPDMYKLTIYLYYYEGYTSTEIARLMNKPQSTIRNYLHRGRAILRKKLGGEINEE
jgi:RNA polymerase sigma-70 factor (ECF subfamily)